MKKAATGRRPAPEDPRTSILFVLALLCASAVLAGERVAESPGVFSLPALKELARLGRAEDLYGKSGGFVLLVGGEDVASEKYARMLRLRGQLKVISRKLGAGSSPAAGTVAVDLEAGKVAFFPGGKEEPRETSSFSGFVPGRPVSLAVCGDRAAVRLESSLPPYHVAVVKLRPTLSLEHLLRTNAQAQAVALTETHAFVVDGTRLHAFDLSSPDRVLEPAATHEKFESAKAVNLVAARGDTVLVAARNRGIYTFRFTPNGFRELSRNGDVREPLALVLAGKKLFVSSPSGLIAFEVGADGKLRAAGSEGEAPEAAAEEVKSGRNPYAEIKQVRWLAASGNYLLAIGTIVTQLVNTERPTAPPARTEVPVVQLIEVSNPAAPSFLWKLQKVETVKTVERNDKGDKVTKWSKIEKTIPACAVLDGEQVYLGFEKSLKPSRYEAGGDIYSTSLGGGVHILSLAEDPVEPTEVGMWMDRKVPTSVVDLAVRGKTIYALDSRYGLWVLDASNPASPKVADSIQLGGEPSALAVTESQYFVGLPPAGVLVLKRATPPTVERFVRTGFHFRDLLVTGARLYLVSSEPELNYGLMGIDLETMKARFLEAKVASDIARIGNYLYTSAGEVFDLRTLASEQGAARGLLAPWGERLCVLAERVPDPDSPAVNSVAVFSTGANPGVLGSVPLPKEVQAPEHIVAVHPLAVLTMGARGFATIELSDTARPRFRSANSEPLRSPVAADFQGSHLVAGERDGTLAILDLAGTGPRLVSRVKLTAGQARCIVVRDGAAFVLANAALQILDLPAPSEVPVVAPLFQRVP